MSAQAEAETPAPEIVSPTEENSSTLRSDQSGETGVDESGSEEMTDEVASPSSAQEAFERALQDEKDNDLEKAIDDCTAAIQLDPDNLEYLTARAEWYGELRNDDKAIEEAAKILEKDPPNLRARLLRGKMFELSGETEKALTEFNVAVEQNPGNSQALLARRDYFGRQGEADKALADSDRIIQLDTDAPAGYLARALTQGSNGNHQEAIKYSESVLQKNPENWLAYLVRATGRASNGDFGEAKKDYDMALKLSPDNVSVLAARSAYYAVTGDYQKSLADLQKAASVEPRNFFIKAELADSLATCPDDKLRDAAKASRLVNEALKLAPNDPFVWRASASVAAENGDFQSAVNWQRKYLGSKSLTQDQRTSAEVRLEVYNSTKPYRENFPPAEKILALNRLTDANEAIKNGNFDRAIVLCSEVIRVDNKNAFAYSVRGLAYGKQKKYDLAIQDFNAAIDLNPKDPEAYHYRAGLFERTRKSKKALNDLLKAYQLDPETGNGMRNNLAWFYATCPDDEVRDGGQAAEYVDRALELRPNDPEIWDTCAAVFAENGDFEDAVQWEQAFLDRKDITEDSRRNGEKRLGLYQQNQPYRQHKENEASQFTASATPPPTGK